MDIITSKFENNCLTLYPHGRVDTNNAAEVEKLITDLCAQFPTDNVIMDADDLEYISSAGLRNVLRLRKMKPSLRIINASSEVYEIFEMTGFSEMIPVEKAYRKFSVDGCQVIGKGAKGTVYRYNPDTVVKVFKSADSLPDIQRERELARKAFVLGIPTAISYDVVRVGESYGSVYELLAAKPYSELIRDDPANVEKYVGDIADLLRLIHSTPVKADEMPDVKGRIEKWMKITAPFLEAADAEKLKALIDAVPDTLNMLHCDYHSNNVMLQNGETLLIDMDTLSHGHPIFELANVYVTYAGFAETDPQNVIDFLGFDDKLALKVWEIFLPKYLESDDAEYIKSVAKKAKLVGAIRVIHHVARRDSESESAKAQIAYFVNVIHNLLNEVDTLDF